MTGRVMRAALWFARGLLTVAERAIRVAEAIQGVSPIPCPCDWCGGRDESQWLN